jgi:RNA polymerase sigma factor (sigma-70 family)
MGLARKAARGEWTGGTPPVGYLYDADSQALIPVPMQAALVHRIFTLYVDRRLGSAAISGLLNDTGQFTSRGRRWTPDRILGVLRNPAYIGQLPFNGERHQASHEPIIDRELFERAQLLLTERSDSASAQAANATDYLLTSLLRCQRCGHGFVGTAAHGNGGVYRYYTCFSRQRHGTARCDQQRLPAGQLEDAEDGSLADLVAAPTAREECEDLLLVPQLLAKLPAIEREVVLLRFFADLSQYEIAARVGFSQMHVSRLLRRAIARMRLQLLPS